MANLKDLIVNGASRFIGALYGSHINAPVYTGNYGTCTTAAGTAAKVVSDIAGFQLKTGATIHVKFTNANSVANPTLNVNSTGAKSIYRYGTTAPSTSAKTSWQAGSVLSLIYDGSAWQLVGWLNDDSTYGTTSSVTSGGTSLITSGGVYTALGGTGVTSTYSSTGTQAVTGAAIASAIGGLDVTGTNAFGAGKTISAWSETDGKVSITSQDISITKSQVSDFPGAATTGAAGLMSAADKTKLDGIATGATANAGTITGITMNGASKGTSGVVDLGTVITAHQDISGKVDKTADGMSEAINLLTTGSSEPSDTDYYVSQYAGGAKTTYHRRTMLALWNYIKTKITGDSSIVKDYLMTKTYTDVIAADTTQANSNFYFVKVVPDSFDVPYIIRYRVKVWVPGQAAYYAIGDCHFTGAISGRAGYDLTNTIRSTSNYPAYYHLFYPASSATNASTHGHVFGVGLRNSTNPTNASYKRSITFEIYETRNCTASFLEAPTLAASIPGRNSLGEYNFSGNGHYPNDNNYDRILSSYERAWAGFSPTDGIAAYTTGKAYAVNNTVVYNNIIYRCTTAITAANNTAWSAVSSSFATFGVPQYTLCAYDEFNKLIPLTRTPGSTAATKLLQTKRFNPSRIYYFNSSSYIATNNAVNNLYAEIPFSSANYSFNLSPAAYRTVYLKGTMDADGFFTMDTSTTTSNVVQVPTNVADTAMNYSTYFVTGQYYVRLGTTSGTAGQLQLFAEKKLYYYDGTYLRETTQSEIENRAKINLILQQLQVNLLDLVTWVDQYNIPENGVKGPYTGFHYSLPLKVEKGTYTLKYTKGQGSNDRIHECKSDGTWIRQIGVATPATAGAGTVVSYDMTFTQGTYIQMSLGRSHTNLQLICKSLD